MGDERERERDKGERNRERETERYLGHSSSVVSLTVIQYLAIPYIISIPQYIKHPMRRVSWVMAVVYCMTLTRSCT